MEHWRDIAGYAGQYQVSNFGAVRSLARGQTKLLSQWQDRDGYCHVSLKKNGKKKNYKVHRLVVSHFVAMLTTELEVNHRDFNRANNHYKNLEAVTVSENRAYTAKNGRHKSPDTAGIANGRARLTEDQVREIHSAKGTNLTLAKHYGISDVSVSKIRRERSWCHLWKQA